jgi:protein-S-isoprenylcysteine O-methyltransferase Ste14
VVAAFCLLQLTRVREEEAALTAAFPAAYPGYASRTARFIPGVI